MKTRVFISYAWESPSFRNSIWELAGWLEKNSNNKLDVITDHLFQYCPPEVGWHVWMLQEIEKSNVVLCVCTDIYNQCFTKEYQGNGGFGITVETAIILNNMITEKLKNNKYYPILPDGGSISHIPKILIPFNNNHYFSSSNNGILKLINKENPVHLSEKQVEEIHAEAEKKIQVEKSIIGQLIPETSDPTHMFFPIQILIRSYLLLNELQKVEVLKNIGVYKVEYDNITSVLRDKKALQDVKDKVLLSEMWEEINKINAFENAQNPFK
jgi:SEFIR domain